MIKEQESNTQAVMSLRDTCIGTIAGAIEVIALQPMLYCKNATQQRLPLTLNLAVLNRGIGVSVGNMAILTGVQYPMFTAIDARVQQPMASSFLSGALSGLICAPMELVMIQQQRFGASLLQTPVQIVRNYGLPKLMRGLPMSAGREACFTAGYLGLPSVLGGAVQRHLGTDATTARVVGTVGAGVCAATVSHPMDTIKTCQQGDVDGKHYRSVLQTARTLYRADGVRRFFSGWSWRTGRMICAVAILNGCKDWLDQTLPGGSCTSEPLI